MPGFFIPDFAGMMPRASARLLEPNRAQNAINAELFSGELRAFRDIQWSATPTKAGTKQTIYRFGQDVSDDTRILRLPGTSGNYASTPDSVAASITGDIDIRARLASSDITPGVIKGLVCKRSGNTAPTASYELLLLTGGKLRLQWHDGAAFHQTADSSVVVPYADNQDMIVRGTLDVDDGAGGHVVTFYTSSDGGATWSQLGTPFVGVGTTQISDSSSPVNVGFDGINAVTVLSGRAYWAEVRNGIGGAVVVSFNAADFAVGATSAASSQTGETWTVSQSGSPAAEIADETRYWFHWLEDVDVVRGPVNNDAAERTYWTGQTEPRVTDSSIALTGGTDYPMAWYKLGVPKPAAAPVAAPNGVGSGDPESRAYVYTYVSVWGEEGPPSDPSNIVNIATGQTCDLSSMSTGPGAGYNIVSKRIYRAVTGNTATDYQFVAEIAVALTTHNDALATDALGEVIRSTLWIPPDSALKGLIVVGNSFLAGYLNNDVWCSEPFLPHAWPVRYRKSTPFGIVSLGSFDRTLVAVTKGEPYAGAAGDPSQLILNKIGGGKAGVSKRGTVSLAGGVAYPCADGLAAVTPSGWQLATDAYFTRKQWQALNPEGFLGARWGQRYVGFYNDGAVQQGFIFDPIDPRAGLIYIDVYPTAAYNDPQRDALYLQIGADIQRWDAASSSRAYTWRSKVFVMPRPINPRFMQVRAVSYPVTVKLYADGALKHTEAVASSLPFALPDGYRATEFEIQAEGTVNVQSVAVAETMAELKGLVT